METAILTKEMMIETIKDMKDTDIILFSNILQGQVSGATKNKLKSFSIGFTNDCFKDPETVGDLMKSKVFGLIIMPKKLMNQKTLKAFEEYQKTHKGTILKCGRCNKKFFSDGVKTKKELDCEIEEHYQEFHKGTYKDRRTSK